MDILSELKLLSIERRTKHICRGCFKKLKRRKQLVQEIRSIEDFLTANTTSTGKRPSESSNVPDVTTTPKKVRGLENAPATSTPVRAALHHGGLSSNLPNLAVLSPVKGPGTTPAEAPDPAKKTASSVDVTVRVKWPSKDKERKLPESLESLGKMLVRGTFKQIAQAAWKAADLKKELVNLMIKEIERETTNLCSRKEPSCLRRTDKESMVNLTLENVTEEVRRRAPLFYSVLSASSTNVRSERRAQKPQSNFAAVGMAAAICLKNRCREMVAVQLLLTTLLYHSGWMVCNYYTLSL